MTQFNWKDPDYEPIFRERYERIKRLRAMDEEQRAGVHLFYAEHPLDWILDWGMTFDPRLASQGKSSAIPFVLFPRQREFVEFMHGCNIDQEDGVVEKSRDIGISWCAIHLAIHTWIYKPGSVVGCGSYEKDRVDKLGVMDSLLEKGRFILRNLPPDLRPPGLNMDQGGHLLENRLLNPTNGAQIVGEIGDKIGRGGRATFYIVDEYAFLKHPETVDGSLASTTECRIYISTANGLGGFFRKTQNEHFRQFRFEWRQDPRKDDTWYQSYGDKWGETTRSREVDIDHHASIEDLLIESKWVEAAHKLRGALVEKGIAVPPRREYSRGIGGLDVGGGRAPSVFIARHGPYISKPESWKSGDGDTTITAERALRHACEMRTEFLHFDAPGLGKGVTSTLRHSPPEMRVMHAAAPADEAPVTREETPRERAAREVANIFAGSQPEETPPVVPGEELVKAKAVNTGATPTTWVVWPDGRTSKQSFVSLKAEIWWSMRQSFQAAYQMWLWVNEEPGGIEHDIDDLIFLPDQCDQLKKELIGPRYMHRPNGKIMVEDKDSLKSRGIPSPDEADALALTFVPISSQAGESKLQGYF